MFEKAPLVARSRRTSLRGLAKIVTDDLTYFFSDADFNGIDLSGQDLTGMDLSKASFAGVRANAGTKVDKPYRAALFSEALRNTHVRSDNFRFLDIDHVVVLARAGQIYAARNELEQIIKITKKLPVFSDDLILCEEIPIEDRVRYYEIWAAQNISVFNAGIVWAIICGGIEEPPLVEQILVDTSIYIKHISESGDAAEMALEHHAHRVVAAYATRLDIHGRSEPIRLWCEMNLELSPRNVERVLNSWSYFTDRNKLMVEFATKFIVMSSSNRRIGEMIARIFAKNSHDYALRGAVLRWLSRNVRAKDADTVLLNLLVVEGSEALLRSVLLKWRRAKPRLGAVPSGRLANAIDKWLSSVPDALLSEASRDKIRSMAQQYRSPALRLLNDR